MNEDELKRIDNKARRQAELELLPSIAFAEVLAVFNKWMILPDPGIVKFLCAIYCTNRLPRKPVWTIIIGPSGGGKTELLNTLIDLPDTHEISLLTPSTFLSGMPGKSDTSLLPQLSGKIMLYKDWTTMLSLNKDAKAEIFSQFREIWDGGMTKSFGNGKTVRWEGKVGLIAASTQAVDMNQQMFTHLGERFINYRLIMPDRKEVALRSLNNDKDHKLMSKELKNAMFSFIKSINWNTEAIPSLPDNTKDELVNLANFCTFARSGVIRDMGFKKEVIFVPAAEMPTRITQQLNTLATGLAMVNGGKLWEEDMKILYKAALDSIPQTNKMVMVEMAKADEQTTSSIAAALGYPTEPIRMYLENLAMLRVCNRVKEGGRADKWTMDPEFADILRHYENIAELTDEEKTRRLKDEVDAYEIEKEWGEMGE